MLLLGCEITEKVNFGDIFSGLDNKCFSPQSFVIFVSLSPSLPGIALLAVMAKNFPPPDANLAGAPAGHLSVLNVHLNV